MEDTRIPDGLLDIFLRPALRLGFSAMVLEMEAKFAAHVNSQAAYAEGLTSLPVALFTGDANEQHYEVETQFFNLALGARKKYSSGLWAPQDSLATVSGPALEEAENRMLDLYVERAGIEDGQAILDLGCGWGSVTLYLAERFPKAKIIGVSNSRTQREHILAEAAAKGFGNVDVKTLNVASEGFAQFLDGVAGQLDRIISIEMFEHMKNYKRLLKLLNGALKSDGKLFIHIFCHKYLAYDFEEDDLNAWMTKNFFRGGTMPSQYLLQRFQEDLVLKNQWNIAGGNYTLTLEGWLRRMDRNKEKLLDIFGQNLTPEDAALQVRRWRIFMIACAEFFAFRGGSEFFVTHLLFDKRA
eukprot:CAMPEP_0204570132 /NCGR_PEP_ID=MMETSP0661-20131031/38141_1 /ASSEMBLY_ACC=CAM_ASM_000606 /TAXON_ID=109239 /ORGANISM="Alexandrium margalefi, Strain AMGDE01CS-322" /LENGTH=354 /DNA_ID=CAMNT_0051578299 /DNA_START=154 /DNA_END=1218 /DNA_ORIENTATION=-